MKKTWTPIPMARYARVSSDKQDVDLSVDHETQSTEGLRRLERIRRGGESVDEAESEALRRQTEFRR